MSKSGLFRACAAIGIALMAVLVPYSAQAAVSPDQGPTTGGTRASSDVPPHKKFVTIKSNFYHNVAIDEDGRLYTWGDTYGIDFLLGRTDTLRPTLVPGMPDDAVFVDAAVGSDFTLAITDDGRGYSWGYGLAGELGTGTSQYGFEPTPMALPAGVSYSHIASVGHTVVALGSDGQAYVFGENPIQQCCTLQKILVPQAYSAPNGLSFVAVAPGYQQSGVFGLASDGSIYAWGTNGFGDLGNGTKTNSATPVKVATPAGVTFTEIASTTHGGYALSSNGEVYAWGRNNDGSLGNGTTVDSPVPVKVAFPDGVSIAHLSVDQGTAAIATDGTVYVWGNNAYGALADGTTTNALVPQKLPLPEGSRATLVTSNVSMSTIFVLDEDGNVYASGRNNKGYLGAGDTAAHAGLVNILDGSLVISSVLFDGIEGTDLVQDGLLWTASTPAHTCGPVDVTVNYSQFGVDYQEVIPGGFNYGTPVTVTGQPDSGSVKKGDLFNTRAAATGDEQPTVQWQSATAADGPWADIAGATQADVEIAVDQTTYLRAVFTNCFGPVISDVAVVTVTEPAPGPGPAPEPSPSPVTPDDKGRSAGDTTNPEPDTWQASNTVAEPTLANTGAVVDITPIIAAAGLLSFGGVLLVLLRVSQRAGSRQES